MYSVDALKHVGVHFVAELGNGIRRKRAANYVLHLGQARMVAVGGAGGCIDEPPDALVARGDEHVQKAIYVRRVRREWVLNGARYGAHRRLVEHVLRPAASFPAALQVANVALDEPEPTRARSRVREYALNVPATAGGEVVQPDNRLAQTEQQLHQVRSNEPCGSGDQPGPGFEPQQLQRSLVPTYVHDISFGMLANR